MIAKYMLHMKMMRLEDLPCKHWRQIVEIVVEKCACVRTYCSLSVFNENPHTSDDKEEQ